MLAFAVLGARLWYLQVIQGETYKQLADANRFRLVQVPASRGIIYSRDGELLVRNRPVYNVVIIPAYLPEDDTAQAEIFARLSDLLNLPITTQVDPVVNRYNGYFEAITRHQYNRQPERQIINPRSRQYRRAPLGIRDAVFQNPFAPFLPVTIAEDVDPRIAAQIEEDRLTLPGVQIEVTPRREYPFGELVSHIMGYVGPIPAEQYNRYEAEGYDLTDIIGLAGLEAEYEDQLRGIKGLETIEVDATGQKIRTVSKSIEARPGHNLKLTLDIGLQKAATEALQEALDETGSKQGVAIAMNPNTGEILAMVSLPSFDNNLFSRGISPRELSLLSKDPWTPLVNHAIAGLYPPGSTYKIIPAAAALQEGVVTPETTFIDEGVLYLPNQFEPDNLDLAQPFYCWLRTGHGRVNFIAGLAWSCDVYFYQVGGGYPPANFQGLGLDRLVRYSEMFGLGEPTGIDLPGEVSGLVPTARWKRLNYAESWLTGDTYNMSIGQGFVLVTPLQILNATAAIANGGTLYRPFLVKEILDADGNVIQVKAPEVIRRLDIDPQNIQMVQAGLRAVTEWDTGTANKNIDVPGIPVAGKTGTAEFCDRYPQCLDADGRVKTSHAWFTAYAPSYNPQIATVVFVYGGGEGSAVAVPVTNKILRYYFGLDGQEDQPSPTESAPAAPDPDELRFTARLLGADRVPQNTASVTGFVLDQAGRGLAGITVEVLAQGEPVAQITTGPTGQFDYLNMDPNRSAEWSLRLAGVSNPAQIDLAVAPGMQYLVEFDARPVEVAASGSP